MVCLGNQRSKTVQQHNILIMQIYAESAQDMLVDEYFRVVFR